MANSMIRKSNPYALVSKYGAVILSVLIFLSVDGLLIYWNALHPHTFRRQEMDFGVYGLNSYKRKNYTDAADNFQKATVQNPKSEAIWYDLGNCDFKLGKYWEASQAYQKAVSLDPSDKDAKFNLALARKRALESLSSGKTITGGVILPIHQTRPNPKDK